MIERLARLGYASKAVVYAIVGYLAAASAANRGGRITDTSGALRVILQQPFGQILLIVLAVGLVGYAAWRVLDAFVDPERHGVDFSGLVTRIGNVVRGSIYGALGIEAFRLSQGMRGSNGREAQMWTARIMDVPFGDWIIGAAGLVIAIYGLSQVWASLKPGLDKTIDLSPIPRSVRPTVVNVSRFGVGARGVIIAVVGWLLIQAALHHDPSEAAGTRESVIELAGAVNGRWLLAAIAAGLLAYAVDQALHARCRRIKAVV